MLVLSRKISKEIVIGTNICIKVLAIKGGNVRIGITASKDVIVDRQEIHESRQILFNEEPFLTPTPINHSSILGA